MDDQLDIFGGAQNWEDTTKKAQARIKALTQAERAALNKLATDATIIGWMRKWPPVPMTDHDVYVRLEKLDTTITAAMVRASIKRLYRDKELRREGVNEGVPIPWNKERYVVR